ncbi:hypothetical protein JVU11DRAFT_2196 [Chiua virens]|nr:hypothetical protein JVU11DRAFT_2196 [Chiua virens]
MERSKIKVILTTCDTKLSHIVSKCAKMFMITKSCFRQTTDAILYHLATGSGFIFCIDYIIRILTAARRRGETSDAKSNIGHNSYSAVFKSTRDHFKARKGQTSKRL